MRFSRVLESGSNIAVIVAAIVLTVTLVRHGGFIQQPARPDPVAQLQGKTLDVAALSIPDAERHLVLAISETCHYCEREMPFYKTLAGQLKGHAALAVVFPENEPDPAKFLADRSVQADRVTSASFQKLGVIATPTLMLVDKSGRISRVWVGALSGHKHEEVVESVRHAL
jgi:thioredoxin-related protein